MSNEVELKLVVDQRFIDFFAQQISEFRILAQGSLFLTNCYYDTADRYFARRKMGLRVRQENGEFTLTLKTDGNVAGGLHIRPEYNIGLASAEPDLSRLAALSGLDIDPDLVLHPVFSTDFSRRFWLTECGNGAEIEIALDQGEISANGKTEPICEAEFELKQGSLNDLLTFVGGLTLTDGVRLSSLSKAKRGYRLADSASPRIIDWPAEWRKITGLTQANQSAVEKTYEILTALLSCEQRLIEETIMVGAARFAREFITTVERIGAFFNLYSYYPDKDRLVAIGDGSRPAEDTAAIGLAESNDYLLGQIREIIRVHSETRDNVQAMNRLTALLHTGHYVKRMLNLIQLTRTE